MDTIRRVALKCSFWFRSDAAYWPKSKGAIRGMIAIAHERLQLQAGPHLQASPHAQAAFEGSAFGVWHPHWQDVPGQDLHEH